MSDTIWDRGQSDTIERMVLARNEIDAHDLASLMQAIDGLSTPVSLLCVLADEPYIRDPYPVATRRGSLGYWPVESPKVLAVRNESPVTVVLMSGTPFFLGFLFYCLRNPEFVGTIFQRYRIARHVVKAQEAAAKRWSEQILDVSGGEVDVGDLPEPPDWIFPR